MNKNTSNTATTNTIHNNQSQSNIIEPIDPQKQFTDNSQTELIYQKKDAQFLSINHLFPSIK